MKSPSLPTHWRHVFINALLCVPPHIRCVPQLKTHKHRLTDSAITESRVTNSTVSPREAGSAPQNAHAVTSFPMREPPVNQAFLKAFALLLCFINTDHMRLDVKVCLNTDLKHWTNERSKLNPSNLLLLSWRSSVLQRFTCLNTPDRCFLQTLPG